MALVDLEEIDCVDRLRRSTAWIAKRTPRYAQRWQQVDLGGGLLDLGEGLLDLGEGFLDLGEGLLDLGEGLLDLGEGLLDLGEGLLDLGEGLLLLPLAAVLTQTTPFDTVRKMTLGMP